MGRGVKQDIQKGLEMLFLCLTRDNNPFAKYNLLAWAYKNKDNALYHKIMDTPRVDVIPQNNFYKRIDSREPPRFEEMPVEEIDRHDW